MGQADRRFGVQEHLGECRLRDRVDMAADRAVGRRQDCVRRPIGHRAQYHGTRVQHRGEADADLSRRRMNHELPAMNPAEAALVRQVLPCRRIATEASLQPGQRIEPRLLDPAADQAVRQICGDRGMGGMHVIGQVRRPGLDLPSQRRQSSPAGIETGRFRQRCVQPGTHSPQERLTLAVGQVGEHVPLQYRQATIGERLPGSAAEPGFERIAGRYRIQRLLMRKSEFGQPGAQVRDRPVTGGGIHQVPPC